MAKEKEAKLPKYYYAVGRRKASTATVRLFEGAGESTVNGKPLKELYSLLVDQTDLNAPFKVLDLVDKFHITAKARGGGKAGQKGAIILGIARAFVKYDETFRSALKKEGLLRRDARIVERKKVNRVKARKRPQFSKR